MKPSEIFREAARLVEINDQRFSCCAIDGAINLSPAGLIYESGGAALSIKCQRLYGALIFGAEGPSISAFLLYNDKGNPTVPDDEARDHRVVALCLAAAIAESDGQ